MTDKCTTAVNPEILSFITNNKIATVCGAIDNKPHCFNCFYSVLEDEACIVFKSSGTTKHIQVFSRNKDVAGTIISSEVTLTKIEGIQFEGVIVEKESIGFKATRSYYARFPFAVTVPGKIWVLELHAIKYTNTTNGIRRKEEWERKQ
jgi:uncharacterized protein